MKPPNNINIVYFYLMSLLCSFSITATSSWVAHIPLQWWPLLIPVLFVLVILSASGCGFVQLNSVFEYILTENVPRDPSQNPNHNVPQVTLPPLEHLTAEYSTNGYEDDRSAVVSMAGPDENEIQEIMFEGICEDDTEQVDNCEQETIRRSECLKDECERTRVTLQMLLLAQTNFERKQGASMHKKRSKLKIKRVAALVPSFRRCFALS